MSGLFTALGLPCSILLHRRKIPFTSFWSSQRRRSSKPFITSNSKRSYSVGTYSEYGVREKFDLYNPGYKFLVVFYFSHIK